MVWVEWWVGLRYCWHFPVFLPYWCYTYFPRIFFPIFTLCRNFLLLKRGAEERYSKSQKRQDFQKIICWRAQGYSRKRLITSFFTFTVHNTFFFHSHRSGWAESFSGGFLLGGCRVSFLFSPFQPPYIFFLLPNNQQSALMEQSWISQMLNRLSWRRVFGPPRSWAWTGRASSCSTGSPPPPFPPPPPSPPPSV